MAGFALAASISPGPVNLLTLRAGALRGWPAGLRVAWGATLGFTALLLLAGLGLQSAWARWPWLNEALHWAGLGFLLWMAWQLARDPGQIGEAGDGGTGAWLAAAAQWLNPKAWLAALAGMGLFAGGGEPSQVVRFAAIYALVCLGSMACWGVAGAWLGRRVQGGAGLKWLNRVLALLLLFSAAALWR
ncbi:LysE family translocator [Inhella sp.]|uniref:LysE family translocator n=1 Tax=Inhella sp. TaxID=1921806 RepID=UPI0035B1653F